MSSEWSVCLCIPKRSVPGDRLIFRRRGRLPWFKLGSSSVSRRQAGVLVSCFNVSTSKERNVWGTTSVKYREMDDDDIRVIVGSKVRCGQVSRCTVHCPPAEVGCRCAELSEGSRGAAQATSRTHAPAAHAQMLRKPAFNDVDCRCYLFIHGHVLVHVSDMVLRRWGPSAWVEPSLLVQPNLRVWRRAKSSSHT